MEGRIVLWRALGLLWKAEFDSLWTAKVCYGRQNCAMEGTWFAMEGRIVLWRALGLLWKAEFVLWRALGFAMEGT